MIEYYLIAIISIAGIGVGIGVWYLISRENVERLDYINKLAWVAVRAARDSIKEDHRGVDKHGYALEIMLRYAKRKEKDILSVAIKAAYQQLKTP